MDDNLYDNPFDSPALWDKLTLEGGAGRFIVPGIVKISAEIGLSEDSAPVAGQDGLQKTLLGYTPAVFSVNIQIWKSEQYRELEKLIGIFKPKKSNQNPQAIVAIHPQIQLYDVKKVYLTNISTQPYNPTDGFLVALKLEEWFPEITGTLDKTAKPNSRPVKSLSPSGNSQPPKAGAATATASGNDWGQAPVKPSTVTPKPKP